MQNRPWHYRKALAALSRGDVIAYPTEAVWGLGCDPWNEFAVARLLELKRRPQAKGLILVAGAASQLACFRSALSASQWRTLTTACEEPTTWLLPNNGILPAWIGGAHDSVAVRLSGHPAVVALCRGFGDLIVSTSANPAGRSPARSELAARCYFGSTVSAYVSAPTGGAAQPSRIIDIVSGQRLR